MVMPTTLLSTTLYPIVATAAIVLVIVLTAIGTLLAIMIGLFDVFGTDK